MSKLLKKIQKMFN